MDKKKGATYSFSAGGVSEKKGNLKTLIETNETIDDWKHNQFDVAVQKNHWLRIELNIIQPGECWLDDFNILWLQPNHHSYL